MPVEWTPERRQQQSDAMKKSHAVKRVHTPSATSLPPPPDIDEVAPIVNPPSTEDIVRASGPATPRAARSSRPARPSSTTVEVIADAVRDSAVVTGNIIHSLTSLQLDDITYDDCGLLLNALSAASTAIATARRLKQESLDAGTHRAPCATCGRLIDISKSGGFQILTVRDEHWQPKNVYFCSQNCLLAKNMPSHAKSEAKRLKEQRSAP